MVGANQKIVRSDARAFLREAPHLTSDRCMHSKQVATDDREALAIAFQHERSGEQRVVHAPGRLPAGSVAVHHHAGVRRDVDRCGAGAERHATSSARRSESSVMFPPLTTIATFLSARRSRSFTAAAVEAAPDSSATMCADRSKSTTACRISSSLSSNMSSMRSMNVFTAIYYACPVARPSAVVSIPPV